MKTRTALATLTVFAATALFPFSAFAGGSIPTLQLKGYVDGHTQKLSWENPTPWCNYGVDGFALYQLDLTNSQTVQNSMLQPFTKLRCGSGHESYYNFDFVSKGRYSWMVAPYMDNFAGNYMNFAMSNVVTLVVSLQPGPFAPQINPISLPFIPQVQPVALPQPATPPATAPAVQSVNLHVQRDGGNFVFHWSSFQGNFDQYMLVESEMVNGQPSKKSFVKYFFEKNQTSFSSNSMIAGRSYQVQIFPYRELNGTVQVIPGSESNRLVVTAPDHQINVKAYARWVGQSPMIYGRISAAKSDSIDGYAVYVVPASSQVSLGDLQPTLFLGKNASLFRLAVQPNQYTVKVYAYKQKLDGTKVFHQPGSNVEEASFIL